MSDCTTAIRRPLGALGCTDPECPVHGAPADRAPRESEEGRVRRASGRVQLPVKDTPDSDSPGAPADREQALRDLANLASWAAEGGGVYVADPIAARVRAFIESRPGTEPQAWKAWRIAEKRRRELEAECEALRAKLEARTQDVADTEKRWGETLAECEELCAENADLRRQRDELTDEASAGVAEADEWRAKVEQLTEALDRIKQNAEAWHGPEPTDPQQGHHRALAVIAEWARDALGASA